MAATYKNWELGSDFDPYENLILNYIYDEWTLEDPPKPDTMQEYDPDDVNKVIFKVGFPSGNRAYQITALRLYTRKIQNLQLNKNWLFEIAIKINIKCKRLSRLDSETNAPTGIPIQLWNMEEEVERILGQYQPNDIVGAFTLEYNQNEREYFADDNFMKSDWSSNTIALLQVEKMTTI